jgi:hypothetical protein
MVTQVSKLMPFKTWDPGAPNNEGPVVFPVEVKLQAVSSREGEDSIFGKATPSAECRMVIHNQAAAAQFDVGRKFYVDFTPTE